MKKIFLCVAIVALVTGCAAPPAGDTGAEPESADESHGQEIVHGDDGSLPEEDFDAGETGDLEQHEDPASDTN